MKCKDCHHWVNYGIVIVNDEVETVGTCVAIRHASRVVQDDYEDELYDRFGTSTVWKPSALEKLAYVQDADNYGGRLITRGDFGCVHFEAEAKT